MCQRSCQEHLESEISRRQALADEVQHIQRDTSIASGQRFGLGPRTRQTDDGPSTLEHLKSRLEVGQGTPGVMFPPCSLMETSLSLLETRPSPYNICPPLCT